MIWACTVFFVMWKASFCCIDSSSDRGASKADICWSFTKGNLGKGDNAMIESEMENKLLNKGFTAKNIAHMRKIISRDGTQKETYSSLLIDLKKRFFLRDV